MTNETYPCYVRIGESVGSKEFVEVPTEEDGTMLLSTVTAQFPDAVGLRFKSESGSWRGVRLNEKIMDPPLEGWRYCEYYIVLPKKAVKRKAVDENESPTDKLSRMTDKEILSDLIVLGLPYAATEGDMKKHFEQFGELELCEIKYDADKKPRGFGFIRYKTVEAVQAVLEATHVLHDRMCIVRFPKEKQDGVPTKLFIGRLPRGTTVEELREHFMEYGSLKDVYIPSPFRGFGFVTYNSQSSAREAMNSTHVIKGTYVNVSHPSPKKTDMNAQSNEAYGNMQGGIQGNMMQGGMQGMPYGGNMKGNMPPGGKMKGNMPPGGNMKGNMPPPGGNMQGNMQMHGPPQTGPRPGMGYGYGYQQGNGNYSSGGYYQTGKSSTGNYTWSKS